MYAILKTADCDTSVFRRRELFTKSGDHGKLSGFLRNTVMADVLEGDDHAALDDIFSLFGSVVEKCFCKLKDALTTTVLSKYGKVMSGAFWMNMQVE